MKNNKPRKLTLPEKELVWQQTISGSQAWLLVHEPYNLLRDKLNIKRMHPSKYDFLNNNKFEYAKQAGILYEKIVFSEICANRPELLHNEKTFFYTGSDELFVGKLSATPDILEIDQNNIIVGIGDIKCSSQAENELFLKESYYYQLLHNAWLLGASKIELFAKGCVTKPINNIIFPEITKEDFARYENLLRNFISAWNAKNETFFDYIVEHKKQEQKLITKELSALESLTVAHLEALKKDHKILEQQIKSIENSFKEKYNQHTILENEFFKIEISQIVREGGIDYAALTKTFNIRPEEIQNFKKEPVVYQKLQIEKKGHTH